MYVKLNLFIWRDLSSKHSLALYEVLKDYQNIKQIRIEIDDFRKVVGLEAGQYKIFTMLRKRVIDVAVEEINKKTDLRVQYELEKRGRKIVAITFDVSGVTQYEVKEKNSIEILSKLQGYGIQEKLAHELIQKHDEDYILANIRVVEEDLQSGKDIRNIPGYLLKAFEVDYRPVETEFDKKKKAQKQEKEAQNRGLALKKMKDQEFLKEFERNKLQQIQSLLKTLNEETLKELKEEFLSGIKSNPIFSRILESKGFEAAIMQLQWNKFLAERYLAEEDHSFEAFKALKAG